MKKKLSIGLFFLPVLLLIAALLVTCKKNTDNNGNPPVITAVRSYVASPNDTVLHSAVANGQWVVITGQNLQNATQINFDGVPAAFNTALFAPNSAVVKIPDIKFSQIDTAKLYTIEYATAGGSTTFSFKLGPAAPTVIAISNVFAAAGDSVYLYGTNLVLVQSFTYAGTKINSFKSNLDGTSLGFLMPPLTPTDQISVVTKSGTVNLKIVATPTITRISNENAYPDDSVYVYGTYLKNIESLTFAGTAVPFYTSSSDGTSVGFALPTLSQSGPVTITTKFGTATTVYNVNIIDFSTSGGFPNGNWLSNFENGSNWKYYGGGQLSAGAGGGWIPYVSDFPSNTGTFMKLATNKLTPGEGNSYSSYAILLNSTQWVPKTNLNDPVDNWAFKFEVNVKKPWNGGTFIIQSSVGDYAALWQPWQVSATQTAAYKTNGWITVTIPLSSFRRSDPTLGQGRGVPIAKITDLVGASGSSECTMYIHNFSTSPTATDFYGAFDNLRVVKIK
nr:glycan-binding surface protein [uncultured Mucilaginibacter sp.]